MLERQRRRGFWCWEDQTHYWQVHRQAGHKEMVRKHYSFIVFGWKHELDMNRKSTWSFFHSLQLVPHPAPRQADTGSNIAPILWAETREVYVCVRESWPAGPTSSRWHFRAAASQLSVSEQRRRGQDRHVYHLPVKSNPRCSQRRGPVKETHRVGGRFKVANQSLRRASCCYGSLQISVLLLRAQKFPVRGESNIGNEAERVLILFFYRFIFHISLAKM